jgi:2-polyprenyl-3-methyl-5-hydroxy-6-metoxy-1,4-benzoquinol methylase
MNKVVEALGADWGEDAEDEQLKHKLADRVVQIPRKVAFVRQYLPEYTKGGFSVLDISCGAGIFLEVMRHYGNEIMGTDVNRFSLLQAQKVPFIPHNSHSLPFPFDAQSYDLVTCLGSFGQYAQQNKIFARPLSEIFAEMFRLARKTVVVKMNSPKTAMEHAKVFKTYPPEWKIEVSDMTIFKYTRKT